MLIGLPPLERTPLDPPYGKQLLKFLYHTDLLKRLPPVEQRAVALQKIEPRAGPAQVQLTFDKIDARAPGNTTR